MVKRGGKSGYTIVELLMAIALVGLMAAAVAGVYELSQRNYMRASSLEAAQDGARVGLDRMANELRLIGSYWVGADCEGIADCNAITAASADSITFRASVHDLYMLNSTAVEATTANTVTGTTVNLSLNGDATGDAFKVYADGNNDFIYIANGGRREVKQIAAGGVSGSTLTLAASLQVTYPVGSIVRDVKTITYTRNAGANTLTRAQGGSGNETLVEGVTGLIFTYFNAAGGVLGAPEPVTPCVGIAGPNPTRALIRQIRVDLAVRGADGSTRCLTTRVRPRSLP